MIRHISVLPKETIKYLAPQANQNFIDATCGFGGHAQLILERNGPEGRLLAIDQDRVALKSAQENLKKYYQRIDFVLKNFTELSLIVRKWPVDIIHGILFDLGVSTYQLKTPDRGFSFNLKTPLDMRMSPQSQRLCARDIVNSWPEKEIKQILKNFGEEPYAGKIAFQIVKARQASPILTTDQLVSAIKNALPPNCRFSRDKHFATQTFRALRMAVNHELENLTSGLKQAALVLSPGGRLVVISFHSLEDRIVKNFFRDTADLKVLTPKPITASVKEVALNPSARSAKLRAAIKNND